ncbi:uncharacterized protein LAJ45_06445 [Morchella importuna]|uniref:uncharacterized protein n=1 Tax=Morchella importuna TaxID=1174673 RepID=UPI001E8DD8A3|nr:uncharacterized protein LAJ45_06445 [Morchella importuna]KAH8149366.1 hypothetical protein LAJ45_06445 [Morchella importuna]
MHTSGMKLTTLFLSLMLASSALGAPVPPASSIPGVGNTPTLGSPPVDKLAPGTTDKLNAGLQGDVGQPEAKPDHLADATDAAAVGDAGPAKKLHPRQGGGHTSPLGGSDPTGGITGSDPTGGITGSDPTGLTGSLTGSLTGKRSAGPPSLDHAGITHEINRAATHSSGNSKRSPVEPIPGINVGENANVPSVDGVKKTLEGVNTPTKREEKKCVKGLDVTHNAAGCTDEITGKVDLNKVNDVNGVAKGATSGETEAPKTEAPKAGTETVTGSDLGSEFVPSADSVTASPTDVKSPAKDAKAPTTGDVTGADAVSGLASGFVPRDETVKKLVDTPLGATTVPV